MTPRSFVLVAAAAQALAGLYWIVFERAGGGFGDLTPLPLSAINGAVILALAVPVALRRRWGAWIAVFGNVLALAGGAFTLWMLTAPNMSLTSAVLLPPPLVSGALALVALPSLWLGRSALG
jgi:hypothetical protein